MSTQRPILFSTPMVEAILAGRKTQTRRIVKPQPKLNFRKDDSVLIYERSPCNWEIKDKKSTDGFSILDSFKCPYGSVGDILWVRETWNQDGNEFFYKADCDINIVGWKPSIHMPKKAARIWLEITDVRIERLIEISENDAICEGVKRYYESEFYVKYGSDNDWCANAYASFSYLWEFINGLESWKLNPWVWVVEYKVIQKP